MLFFNFSDHLEKDGSLIITLLFSLFASSEKGISLGKFRISLPTLLIAGVGLSLIAICIIGIIVLQMNLESFYDVPLNGTTNISFEDPYASDVDTSLLMGYYLLCATGPVLLILAILRRFIAGKSNT